MSILIGKIVHIQLCFFFFFFSYLISNARSHAMNNLFFPSVSSTLCILLFFRFTAMGKKKNKKSSQLPPQPSSLAPPPPTPNDLLATYGKDLSPESLHILQQALQEAEKRHKENLRQVKMQFKEHIVCLGNALHHLSGRISNLAIRELLRRARNLVAANSFARLKE